MKNTCSIYSSGSFYGFGMHSLSDVWRHLTR